MPLSEHEQRLFEQIERSLAEDPKFASAVRASDPRFHARRRLLVAAGVIIAGLALLVYGAVIKTRRWQWRDSLSCWPRRRSRCSRTVGRSHLTCTSSGARRVVAGPAAVPAGGRVSSTGWRTGGGSARRGTADPVPPLTRGSTSPRADRPG
ncbi:hypothetical protein GCM10029963_67480 [Micromonospora andamanensis]